MTDTDRPRLTDLGDRWVDLDEVISVRVTGDPMGSTMIARLGLRNGETEIVRIPGTIDRSAPTAEDREEVRLWLLNYLGGDLLEGIDYGRTDS